MSHILKVQITLLLMHYLVYSCLECLKRELKHPQSQAISKGSRKTYSQGQRVYMSFCARFNFHHTPFARILCTYL